MKPVSREIIKYLGGVDGLMVNKIEKVIEKLSSNSKDSLCSLCNNDLGESISSQSSHNYG